MSTTIRIWALSILLMIGLEAAVSSTSAKAEQTATPEGGARKLEFESIRLEETDEHPPATIDLLFRPVNIERRPVILMLGALDVTVPPAWAMGLLDDGYLLAAFTVDHPPDPDPKRRPQWLHFDQRFAHFYVQMGQRVPVDAGWVMDRLSARADVDPNKFGWLGSSTTGIPAFAVAVQDPRLKAVVTFVATGAYEQWINSWRANNLWQGDDGDWWPETKQLFAYDPIRHVEKMYPTAVLMVNGGDDHVIDISSVRAFAAAARPFYQDDPDRLRLVVYEGMGHNLPTDIIKMYAEHWFHRYLQTNGAAAPSPSLSIAPQNRGRAQPTEINSASHQSLVEQKTHKATE